MYSVSMRRFFSKTENFLKNSVFNIYGLRAALSQGKVESMHREQFIHFYPAHQPQQRLESSFDSEVLN